MFLKWICSQCIPLNLPMLIWFGKPASECPKELSKKRTAAIVRCHIFSENWNQLLVCVWQRERNRENHVHGLVRKEIHKMRQVSLSFSLTLSLTVCTHVEFVPAQLQRQPSAAAAAAAGNLKPVFYLKDGGGGGGGERGGEKADLRVPTVDKDHWNGPGRVKEGRERQMGREGSRGVGGLGWGVDVYQTWSDVEL